HRVVRRVLNHVEGDVAEIAFVSQPVAPTNACPAVAESVPGKTETRREVIFVRLPQTTDRTVAGNLHAAVANAFLQRGAWAKVEVLIQLRVLVVLYAVLLVAQAKIQNQIRPDAKRIVHVRTACVVAIAA